MVFVRSLFLAGGVLLLSAEAGSRPGGRGTFLCFAKEKYPKERRPYCLRPLRCATGQPEVLGCGVRRVTHCAPVALRSDRRGESVDEAPVCPAAHPRHPASCAPQAHTEGVGSLTTQQPYGPSLRSDLSSRAQAPCAAQSRPSAAMACGDVRLRVPFCACLEAQGRGCVRVPQDTRTSCTDSPQLFERSAQRAVSSAAHPLTEHRRLPVAQRRDTHSRVALSLVTFFRRSERKLLARRATPGLRPALKHVARSASKLPPLSTSMLNASKFIATSAF